jgi:hypothetical protein
VADRPGDTLVLTGSVAAGIDYRVVSGRGPFLGQEALPVDSAAADDVARALRRLLAQSSGAEVEALSRSGIDAIYAPDADPELTRRIDAAPLLELSGSDSAASRVWTLTPEPQLDRASAPWWHRVVMGWQVLVWIAAIVLTVPVRRRAAPDPLGDDEVLV